MKEVEWKLISELMKNSRRSDRDLAKAIGTSQPPVTRMRHKLEKEGIIKEYAMIPDFLKIGYELLSLTFVQLKKVLSQEDVEKARKIAQEMKGRELFESILIERGMGLGYTGVLVSLHKDYASFLEFTEWLKQFDFLELSKIDSFLINLADRLHYRPLTFSALAQHLLTIKGKEGMSHE